MWLRLTSDWRFVRVNPSLRAKATLVLVTSIAKQSRANGNVSFGHSPTTNVDNPNALIEIVAFGSFEVLLTRLVSNNFNR